MAKRPTPSSLDEDLWLTRAQIARHYGIARSTVTRRADRLKAIGHLKTRIADDGGELISLASYELEVARTIDGVRAGASRARKERKAERSRLPAADIEATDDPMIFRGLPGQPETAYFVLLDDIGPSLAELLDKQTRIIGRLKDQAREIAGLAEPKTVETALCELWREMHDEMLAANEACGYRYVRVTLP